MWFAALNPPGQRWLLHRLADRLLDGSPEVLGLLADNPFSERPPTQIRFLFYRYGFTSFLKKQRTGAWWGRQYQGTYGPLKKQPQAKQG